MNGYFNFFPVGIPLSTSEPLTVGHSFMVLSKRSFFIQDTFFL